VTPEEAVVTTAGEFFAEGSLVAMLILPAEIQAHHLEAY
jgi:hypothetical protein